MTLIEELFAKGVMTMGPSKSDPARQVGVFRPEAMSQLPAVQAAEMENLRWIAGEWSYENHVPASPLNPAYVDGGCSRFSFCEKDAWICAVAPDGKELRLMTFDPFSRQWIYMLARGSYGMLRSGQGWAEDQIVFEGAMTMIGIDCEWRMTWKKETEDAFGFINERRGTDGLWEYIDEWQFVRK